MVEGLDNGGKGEEEESALSPQTRDNKRRSGMDCWVD